MQITVDIPDQLAVQLTPNEPDRPRRLLEDAAIGAYCRDAITRFELQTILGFETKIELDGFLKRLGVDHGSYSGQDLIDDVAAMTERFARESKR